MKEPLDLYKPPADVEKILAEQKERIWQKVQMEVAKSEGLDEASYHILRVRPVDSVGQSSDSFDGVGRGSHGELNDRRSKPVSRRRRWDVAPILAAAAAVVVFAGGAWGMLSREPSVQQWISGLGKSTMGKNPPNTGQNGGNDTNNSSSQNPPNSHQNTTLEPPAGFTATSLTMNNVMPAMPGQFIAHSSPASPDGRWMAIEKPGQSGTWLENMSGQMFKVSDKMLAIQASTPQSGVIMGYSAGGASTVLAYNPVAVNGPTTTLFPMASDKQSQLTIWARESVSGNWLSIETNGANYTQGSKSWVDVNGKRDPKIPNFVQAAWSPVNGNLVTVLVPDGARQISSAYEKFSLVNYNVKTQTETTLSNGIVCDVEGGTDGLISWSPDGTKIKVLTRDGLGVLSVNAQGGPASSLMVEKSVYGLMVWLDGNTMLVTDISTGLPSNKLTTYTWPTPNQGKRQAGPVLEGNITAMQATGTGEAVVQSENGLWLVNSRQGIRVATGQFNAWWYDTANGKLYVVPQGSKRIFAKSLQGLLSTGGSAS